MEKFILLADDLGDQSESGILRSQLLQDLAAKLCERLNQNLWALYVDSNPKTGLPVFDEKLERQKQEALSTLEEILKRNHINFKIDCKSGDPASVILTEAKESARLDFVILGAQKKTGLKKALLGSVSEEVVRHVQVPVLVLGPEAQRHKFKIREPNAIRILFLSDLTAASSLAEEFALKFAARLNASLTFCHSVGHKISHLKEMIYSHRVSTKSVDLILKEISERAEVDLAKKIEQLQTKGLNVQSLLLKNEEDLSMNINSVVDEKYDIIVMGTHSRGKILTSFLGSTARNLVLSSAVPVLIVRSPLT
ncbi:MAG TPA: universal stress protein [Bdellovibrio sp.]|uniref:universal stress protein n=1 Tax=Bdellovibrio sp. TaxID=28201 RepID=UPI002EDBCC49